jgi:hypothetical protein
LAETDTTPFCVHCEDETNHESTDCPNLKRQKEYTRDQDLRASFYRSKQGIGERELSQKDEAHDDQWQRILAKQEARNAERLAYERELKIQENSDKLESEAQKIFEGLTSTHEIINAFDGLVDKASRKGYTHTPRKLDSAAASPRSKSPLRPLNIILPAMAATVPFAFQALTEGATILGNAPAIIAVLTAISVASLVSLVTRSRAARDNNLRILQQQAPAAAAKINDPQSILASDIPSSANIGSIIHALANSLHNQENLNITLENVGKHVKQLETEKETTEETLAKTLDKKKALEKSVAELTNDKKDLQNEVSTLERELKGKNITDESTTVQTLKTELSSAREQLNTANAQLTASRLWLDRVNSHLRAALSRIQAATTATTVVLRRLRLEAANRELLAALAGPSSPAEASQRNLDAPPPTETPSEYDIFDEQYADPPTVPRRETAFASNNPFRVRAGTVPEPSPNDTPFASPLPGIHADRFIEPKQPWEFDDSVTRYQQWRTEVRLFVSSQGHRFRIVGEVLNVIMSWTKEGTRAKRRMQSLIRAIENPGSVEHGQFSTLTTAAQTADWIMSHLDLTFLDHTEHLKKGQKLKDLKQTGSWSTFFNIADDLRLDLGLTEENVLQFVLTGMDVHLRFHIAQRLNKNVSELTWMDLQTTGPMVEQDRKLLGESPSAPRSHHSSSPSGPAARQAQPVTPAPSAPAQAGTPAASPVALPCFDELRNKQRIVVPEAARGRIRGNEPLLRYLVDNQLCLSCRCGKSLHGSSAVGPGRFVSKEQFDAGKTPLPSSQ